MKPENFRIIDRVENWQEAIRIAAKPLVIEHSITENYIEAMIQTVHELGSYIVLAPLFAMPHAAPSESVLKTGLACLKIREGVYFGDEEDSKAIIVLPIAATSGDEHMRMIQLIATILGDQSIFDLLIKAETSMEMYQIFLDAQIEAEGV